MAGLGLVLIDGHWHPPHDSMREDATDGGLSAAKGIDQRRHQSCCAIFCRQQPNDILVQAQGDVGLMIQGNRDISLLSARKKHTYKEGELA